MNISANGSTSPDDHVGGPIGIYAQSGGGSGFSGGSLQLEANFEGSVWHPVGSAITAAGYSTNSVPPCKLRFTLAGGGAGINIDCGWRPIPPKV